MLPSNRTLCSCLRESNWGSKLQHSFRHKSGVIGFLFRSSLVVFLSDDWERKKPQSHVKLLLTSELNEVSRWSLWPPERYLRLIKRHFEMVMQQQHHAFTIAVNSQGYISKVGRHANRKNLTLIMTSFGKLRNIISWRDINDQGFLKMLLASISFGPLPH